MDKDQCNANGGRFEDGKCYFQDRKKSIKKKATLIFLMLSLLIDAFGYLSYVFPGFGEMIDIVWAPLSAGILYVMYGNAFASLGQALEEILPFTDFIPSATITWIYYFVKEAIL